MQTIVSFKMTSSSAKEVGFGSAVSNKYGRIVVARYRPQDEAGVSDSTPEDGVKQKEPSMAQADPSMAKADASMEQVDPSMAQADEETSDEPGNEQHLHGLNPLW